jgi:hypothetical protein
MVHLHFPPPHRSSGAVLRRFDDVRILHHPNRPESSSSRECLNDNIRYTASPASRSPTSHRTRIDLDLDLDLAKQYSQCT